MDDRIEDILEIDAFGKAVGGDEDFLLAVVHRLDARAALIRRHLAMDDLDPHAAERLLQRPSDPLSGRDIPAEDDGREALLEHRLQPAQQRRKLRVFVWPLDEPSRQVDERGEIAVLGRGRLGVVGAEGLLASVEEGFDIDLGALGARVQGLQGGRGA